MKTVPFAAAAGIALLSLPFAAFAQVYYYVPNTTSGAFNYGSSYNSPIPQSAMPYVELGSQMQPASPAGGQQSQEQYEGYYQPSSYYYYPQQYQYQSQYQSQTYYPSSNYYAPSYEYYPYETSYYDEYEMPACDDSYGYYSTCGTYSEDPYSTSWY